MKKFISLSVGILVIAGISTFVAYRYNADFAAGFVLVVKWISALIALSVKGFTFEALLGWLAFQARKSIRPLITRVIPGLLIFALPMSWYLHIRDQAQALQHRAVIIMNWAKTRHSWLFGQKLAVAVAVIASGLVLLLSLVFFSAWFIYLFGWTLIWKVLLFPILRMIESILFRTFSGFLFMTGLRPLWEKQSWIKNRKTFWKRFTIKFLRKRRLVVKQARQKLQREKFDAIEEKSLTSTVDT